MRILYFYQYFSTPKGSWGTRVYEYAKEWVKKGHKVTVVTSIYSKSDLTANKLIERQQVEGIDLIVLNIKIDNKQSPLKRIWTFIQYCYLASYFAITEKYDIAVASSGPITVGLPGLVSRYFRRKKLVFEVRDLWPDTAIDMGYVNNKLFQKVLYKIENICYEASSLIVTLSPGAKDNIIERYREYNIISVPNSANIKLFSRKSNEELPNNLKKNKYAIYTGNIGQVNNSQLLYEASKILKDKDSEIKIVLVGDGQDRDYLLQKSLSEGLNDQFIMLGLMPKEELVPLVKSSLASLIPLANKPILNTSSPNKLFESLAAGVPVIQTTSGWMKDMLDNDNVGFTVSPVDPRELVDVLQKLNETPELRKQISEDASRLAKQRFDKKVLANKMIEAIEIV